MTIYLHERSAWEAAAAGYLLKNASLNSSFEVTAEIACQLVWPVTGALHRLYHPLPGVRRHQLRVFQRARYSGGRHAGEFGNNPDGGHVAVVLSCVSRTLSCTAINCQISVI